MSTARQFPADWINEVHINNWDKAPNLPEESRDRWLAGVWHFIAESGHLERNELEKLKKWPLLPTVGGGLVAPVQSQVRSAHLRDPNALTRHEQIPTSTFHRPL